MPVYITEEIIHSSVTALSVYDYMALLSGNEPTCGKKLSRRADSTRRTVEEGRRRAVDELYNIYSAHWEDQKWANDCAIEIEKHQGVIGGGDYIGGLVPDEPENGKSGPGVQIREPLANKTTQN